MISLVWEPHARTGGGVLVRHNVPGQPSHFLMRDDRHSDQLFRGGRAKKHRMRKDARLRTIMLIGIRWGGGGGPHETIDVIVYALDREHVDHRDDMRRQIAELFRKPLPIGMTTRGAF